VQDGGHVGVEARHDVGDAPDAGSERAHDLGLAHEPMRDILGDLSCGRSIGGP
jgi:hypothetical protein